MHSYCPTVRDDKVVRLLESIVFQTQSRSQYIFWYYISICCRTSQPHIKATQGPERRD